MTIGFTKEWCQHMAQLEQESSASFDVGGQPEALRFADGLDSFASHVPAYGMTPEPLRAAAAELRRLQNALEMAVSDAQRSWRELAAAEARNVTLTDDAARDGGLWAVNVHGPDDLYAMPSRAAALEHANELNIYFGEHTGKHEYDAVMRAVVIPWEYGEESHAADIQARAAASISTNPAGDTHADPR